MKVLLLVLALLVAAVQAVCNPGTFNTTAGGCSACPIGRFSAVVDANACAPCPPGQFQNSPGATECKSCEPGSFSNATGHSVCTTCAPTYVSSETGSTSCVHCQGPTLVANTGQTLCLTDLCVAPTTLSPSCDAYSTCTFDRTKATRACSGCPEWFSGNGYTGCTYNKYGKFVQGIWVMFVLFAVCGVWILGAYWWDNGNPCAGQQRSVVP